MLVADLFFLRFARMFYLPSRHDVVQRVQKVEIALNVFPIEIHILLGHVQRRVPQNRL